MAKNSGYSIQYNPFLECWYIKSWQRLSELSIHREVVSEDFFSYKEAQAALSEFEIQ